MSSSELKHAGGGGVAAGGGGGGGMGEGEDGLVVREARGAPGDRGGGLRRDVGDEPWEEVDGAVDGAHGRPRQPARQQREQVPRPER
ncbi:Os08g0425050, partial [Oryza sativa Japonica Group]